MCSHPGRRSVRVVRVARVLAAVRVLRVRWLTCPVVVFFFFLRVVAVFFLLESEKSEYISLVSDMSSSVVIDVVSVCFFGLIETDVGTRAVDVDADEDAAATTGVVATNPVDVRRRFVGGLS